MIGRIKSSNDEAKFWFEQAVAYYKSSKVLDTSNYENTALPIITLQSFSIECALKSFLLNFNGKVEKGHNLINLFNHLPLEIQLDLKKKFKELHSYDLLKCLTEVSNDFIDSRYFFEELRTSPVSRCFATGYLDAIAEFLTTYGESIFNH